MPVTARLSRKFYDQFGDEIANELLDWFNQVDAAYKSDLRDLSEVYFARFDAKLEQRAAQLEAKLDQRTAEPDAKIELRGAELRTEMGAGFARAEVRLDAGLASLRAELVKWMFLFWAGTALTVVALLKV